MAIHIILATVECDGCGKHFKVELDPAYRGSEKDDLFDIVEDYVRGDGAGSVQGEMMLCRLCTNTVDQALDEDAEPTGFQVNQILNAAHPTQTHRRME